MVPKSSGKSSSVVHKNKSDVKICLKFQLFNGWMNSLGHQLVRPRPDSGLWNYRSRSMSYEDIHHLNVTIM